MSSIDYLSLINFCPKCGTEYLAQNKAALGEFKCNHCGFRNYVKSFPTVSTIIPNLDQQDEILLARRAIDPGKGYLESPGGFVDYNEAPAVAIVRELKEELGVEAEVVQILACSNELYEQNEITYPIVGLFFLMQPVSMSAIKLDLNENVEVVSVPLADILAGKVQFFWNSTMQAIENYANLRYHHANE